MIVQPDAVVYPGGGLPVQNLDKFFLENRAAGQTFLVDPTRRTTLVGAGGTRLTVAPNAFADPSGWPISLPVSLFLREVFTRPEMVLCGLTNTSEDRIMETAGQLLVKAQAENQNLTLTSPVAIDLPLQEGIDNPLASQLFSGGISRTSSFGSGLRFDWKSADSKNIQLKSLGEKKYLNFFIEDLNWWNCTSIFHRRRHRIMLSVRWAPQEIPIEDLAAFLVFKDFNAVARMYPGRHGFSSWNIPKGLTARIILLGISGDRMLLGKSPWEVTSAKPVHLQLEPYEKDQAIVKITEWC